MQNTEIRINVQAKNRCDDVIVINKLKLLYCSIYCLQIQVEGQQCDQQDDQLPGLPQEDLHLERLP